MRKSTRSLTRRKFHTDTSILQPFQPTQKADLLGSAIQNGSVNAHKSTCATHPKAKRVKKKKKENFSPFSHLNRSTKGHEAKPTDRPKKQARDQAESSKKKKNPQHPETSQAHGSMNRWIDVRQNKVAGGGIWPWRGWRRRGRIRRGRKPWRGVARRWKAASTKRVTATGRRREDGRLGEAAGYLYSWRRRRIECIDGGAHVAASCPARADLADGRFASGPRCWWAE